MAASPESTRIDVVLEPNPDLADGQQRAIAHDCGMSGIGLIIMWPMGETNAHRLDV